MPKGQFCIYRTLDRKYLLGCEFDNVTDYYSCKSVMINHCPHLLEGISMTNKELRQRLIELITQNCEIHSVDNGEFIETAVNWAEIVDRLIKNGVTIRERGEWKEVYQNKQATVYECSKCHHLSFGTSDYCICGADMRGTAIRDEAVESRQNIKFKTGDNAKIAGNVTEHKFEIGTVVRLEKHDTDYKAFANDDYWWVTDDDLEPVEDEE